MKPYLPVFAVLATSLMSSGFVPSLKASESDKKTLITISQPVAVEGVILPAGKYVLRLLDSSSMRNIVFIFDGKETRLITTVKAIQTDRLEPTDKSEFAFYEASAGQPAALHTWFYPGAFSGFEFLKPQHTAAVQSSASGD
jgi:hypothetical protein